MQYVFTKEMPYACFIYSIFYLQIPNILHILIKFENSYILDK